MPSRRPERMTRTYLDAQYAQSDGLRIRYETHARYSERPDSFRDWALQQLAPAAGERIADIGCGPGSYQPSMCAAGACVIAIDRSAGMLREARTHVIAGGAIDVRCVNASAEHLPLADATCDRVLAAHMLYYVSDIAAALREMRRVLKPGGRLVITANMGAPSALDDIEARSARSLHVGKLTVNSSVSFSMDDEEIVREVFPECRRVMREDALLFPSSEPAMRYWLSFAPDQARGHPAREALLPRLAEEMRARIDAIVARDGVFRVEKHAGCFVADLSR